MCCAGSSQRARQAARDARGETLPASLAPEAGGPSVLNPSFVPLRAGTQPQARKRGAHEKPKGKAAPKAKRGKGDEA